MPSGPPPLKCWQPWRGWLPSTHKTVKHLTEREDCQGCQACQRCQDFKSATKLPQLHSGAAPGRRRSEDALSAYACSGRVFRPKDRALLRAPPRNCSRLFVQFLADMRSKRQVPSLSFEVLDALQQIVE